MSNKTCLTNFIWIIIIMTWMFIIIIPPEKIPTGDEPLEHQVI